MGYVQSVSAPSSYSTIQIPALIQTPSRLIPQQYQVAYECSPYYYLKNPDFLNKEVPSPRLIPKLDRGVNAPPETEMDANPSEDSNGNPPERQKRDNIIAFNSNQPDSSSDGNKNTADQTWANPASGGAGLLQYMADRRIYNPGRPKNWETCDDDYLLERQVAPKKKYDRTGGKGLV